MESSDPLADLPWKKYTIEVDGGDKSGMLGYDIGQARHEILDRGSGKTSGASVVRDMDDDRSLYSLQICQPSQYTRFLGLLGHKNE